MKLKLTLAIGAVLLGISGAAFAITDSEANPTFPLNFANPGARSMGMGGAFLGLADDATAAYANPAGLTQLVTPEVSAEVRRTDYSIPFVNGGNANTNPFDASGLHTANASSSDNNLSYLSIVYPKGDWSFALYRDEALRFHTGYSSDLAGETADGGSTGFLFPVRAATNLKIVDYGLSVAWKASDRISLGVGLAYDDFSIESTGETLGIAGLWTNPEVPLYSFSQFGSDRALGINLGARFAFNEQWSAGLIYRRGPKFSYEANNVTLADVTFNSDGTLTSTPLSTPEVGTDLKNVHFKVPDEFGGGLSWHPSSSWVINFDADYIQYSQLTRGIQSLFGNDASTVSRLTIPNGTEVHLGGEYTFTQMTRPFSLRAGIWHDPRHTIEFTGTQNIDPSVVGLAMLFSGGKGSQNHRSLGFGWAFTKFEIDGAADFSDLTDSYSISAVYHF